MHTGPFHLGKVYTYINGSLAVIWVAFITSLFVLPTVRPLHDLSAQLCRAVLCCAVPCCAVLCCAVLCCAVLCCAPKQRGDLWTSVDDGHMFKQ